jgi:hypothetical protein
MKKTIKDLVSKIMNNIPKIVLFFIDVTITRVPNEDPGDPHTWGFLLILLPHSRGIKCLIPHIPHSSRNSKSDSSYSS